ncbi:hypothetical protein CC80DRAFT_555698 [Byssothecium circinans]|uniref:Uncharacterized protein n=1 Tax=Byssothecium circinans TaxID=147558 RepID=A0A6A5TBL6_9PLEO|nr:hypothetical protein CC80DRAFT_555698 [Byssothecium circinans]
MEFVGELNSTAFNSLRQHDDFRRSTFFAKGIVDVEQAIWIDRQAVDILLRALGYRAITCRQLSMPVADYANSTFTIRTRPDILRAVFDKLEVFKITEVYNNVDNKIPDAPREVTTPIMPSLTQLELPYWYYGRMGGNSKFNFKTPTKFPKLMHLTISNICTLLPLESLAQFTIRLKDTLKYLSILRGNCISYRENIHTKKFEVECFSHFLETVSQAGVYLDSFTLWNQKETDNIPENPVVPRWWPESLPTVAQKMIVHPSYEIMSEYHAKEEPSSSANRSQE